MSVNKFLVPEGFTPILLDTHRTSFLKKIRFSEIGADEDLEKSDVVSSGAKLVIGKKIPKWFKTPISQAKDMMDEHCLRYGKKLWLCPNTKLDSIVLPGLKLCEKTFHFNKTKLRFGYPDYVEEHAKACDDDPDLPFGFGDLIRAQHHPWSYVDSQLQFSFQVNVDVKKVLTEDFLDDVANESQDHLDQIMATAKANNAYPKITKKNVNRLITLKHRMESVLILEPKAQYVIDVIEEFTDNFKLPYSKEEVRKLLNVLHLMTNKQLFLNMADLDSQNSDRKPYTLDQLQTDLATNVSLSL